MDSKYQKAIYVPDEYGFARIGSVANFLTREMSLDVHAFDMAKLNVLGVISNNQSECVMTIQSNAYSSETSNAWSTSSAAKVSAGVPFFRVSVESTVMNNNSTLNTENGTSLIVGMAYIDYELRVKHKIKEDDWYRCGTSEFQDSLRPMADAIAAYKKAIDDNDATAATAAQTAWEKAYVDFTLDFGHGFVSALKLICCAGGQLTSSYNSEGSRQQQKYGGSVAAGGLFKREQEGGGVASGWAAEQANNGSTGNVQAVQLALPSKSPCATWASGFVTQYANMKISDIAKQPPAVPAAPAQNVSPPTVPDIKKPDSDIAPLPKVQLTSTADMVEYMRAQQMHADGYDIKTTTWADYQKAVADKANGLNKDAVAEKKPEPAPESARPQTDGALESIEDEADLATGTLGDLDLGEYAIYDMEFTSYAEIFPSLVFHAAAPTVAGVYLAKINMFTMTRQLIASYLHFLASLPDTFTGGFVTPRVAQAFEDSLNLYYRYLSGVFDSQQSQPIITEEGYSKIVGEFDNILFKTTYFADTPDGQLLGRGVYDYFIAHFDSLSNAPYGFLLTAAGGYYHPKWGTWSVEGLDYFPGALQLTERAHQAFDVGDMIQESYRVYPIVVPKGWNNPAGIGLAVYVPWKKANLLDIRSADPNATQQDKENAAEQDKKDAAINWCVFGMGVMSGRADLSPGFSAKDWLPFELFKRSANDIGFGAKDVTNKHELVAVKYPVDDSNKNKVDGYFLFGGRLNMAPWSQNASAQKQFPYDKAVVDAAVSLPISPITLTPVDYKDVTGGYIHGIPMWCELPFDLVKASALSGIS